MGQDSRVLLGSSFGVAAVEYAEHRPDYALAAVRWALEPAPGRRVLDLGAGTGKLTGTLVALGVDVVAVEPDPAMLVELRRALPAVRALPGSAEAIPLPDASVDAVLAGNALHWFDMAAAGPEIARVLAPGGIMAGLWNVMDDRVDWLPSWGGSAEARPSAHVTRCAAGAQRRRACTFPLSAWSPGSARRSRSSSHTGSVVAPTRSSRRLRPVRGCWSCPNRSDGPRWAGSVLSSRADRRRRATTSPSRC